MAAPAQFLTDTIRFTAMLCRESAADVGTITRVVAGLCRTARTLQRLNEAACNRELTVREEGRGDRLAAEAAKLVADLGHGFTARTQGDPRGCALIVGVPSGRSDDWGGRGLCVPY